MRKMLIVGGDAFLVAAMRLSLRYVSGVNILAIREDEDGLAEAVRDAQPDIIVIQAGAEQERALERLRQARAERAEALTVFVAAELELDLLEEAAECGALVCLGSAALVSQLQALLAETRRGEPGGRHIALATVKSWRPAEVVEQPVPAEPECPLTGRELEILRAVAKGHSNARIGRELWISEQTVKFHLSKVYRKLEVSNRTEASRYVLMHDLLAGRRRVRRLPVPARGYGAVGSTGNGHYAVGTG
jgi:DNA-binding NarL/FixJ family response regulator